MKSEFLRLGKSDLLRGLLVAAGSAALTTLYKIIEAGGSITLADVKLIALAGAGAGVSYLIKNYFTNSADKIAAPENPKV